MAPLQSATVSEDAEVVSMQAFLLGGGLAQLVTSLVASTKLINAGPS